MLPVGLEPAPVTFAESVTIWLRAVAEGAGGCKVTAADGPKAAVSDRVVGVPPATESVAVLVTLLSVVVLEAITVSAIGGYEKLGCSESERVHETCDRVQAQPAPVRFVAVSAAGRLATTWTATPDMATLPAFRTSIE